MFLVLPGQLQRQVRRVQEKVGWWNHGFQIPGQNQGQRETSCQGSCSEDDLGAMIMFLLVT